MAERKRPPSGSIAAVGYLRRSTSRQEKSLEDQRAEIEQYAAANGYRIVRWFQDDGISGDATECRTGFLSLHSAACNGRNFNVILVWDQDRFGRFDSMEAGYWIHPLRKAGVTLVSVTEGPINWDDFTGRVMYSLKQEGKHQFFATYPATSPAARSATPRRACFAVKRHPTVMTGCSSTRKASIGRGFATGRSLESPAAGERCSSRPTTR